MSEPTTRRHDRGGKAIRVLAWAALVLLLVPTTVREIVAFISGRQRAEAAEAHAASADRLASAGEFPAAIVALAAARELLPTDVALQERGSRLLVRAAAEAPATVHDTSLPAVQFAIARYEEATAVGETARGQLALRRGELAAADKALNAATQADPAYAPALLALGALRRAQGKLPEALAAFEKARSLAPHSTLAANNLGVALVESGRPIEAVGPLSEALAAREDATTRVNLGVALIATGRVDEALGHLRRATELEPASLEAWRRRADAHVRLSQPAEAAAALDQATALARDSRALFELALLEQAIERFEHAARLLARVREAAPRDAEAAYQLGATLQRVGDAEAAAAALEDYLRLADGRPEEQVRAADVRAVLEAAAAAPVPQAPTGEPEPPPKEPSPEAPLREPAGEAPRPDSPR